MIEVRRLNIGTKPRGRTIVLSGEVKKEGEKLYLVSPEGEVKFLDIDNYLSVTVSFEVSSRWQEFVAWSGEPLIRGNFKVKSITIDSIATEDTESEW